MAGNAISAQCKTKCLSHQSYPRVEQTAFEGSEFIVIWVFKRRLHSHLVITFLLNIVSFSESNELCQFGINLMKKRQLNYEHIWIAVACVVKFEMELVALV